MELSIRRRLNNYEMAEAASVLQRMQNVTLDDCKEDSQGYMASKEMEHSLVRHAMTCFRNLQWNMKKNGLGKWQGRQKHQPKLLSLAGVLPMERAQHRTGCKRKDDSLQQVFSM